MLVFDVLCSLGSRRWLAVPPILFLAGWLAVDYVQYDFQSQRARITNVWDGPLSTMADASLVVFVFVLGFALVTGDLYVRSLSSGRAAMTLVRARTRDSWWAAKVGALGVLALVYSAVSFCSILTASAFRLPLSLEPSKASEAPWNSPESLYPRFVELPIPLFFIVVVLYTALALWAVGAIILWISVLYPRPVVPATAGLLWVILGSPLIAPLYQREGVGTLDPMYHVSYVIHFTTSSNQATPWVSSLILIAATLSLVLCAGAWKLRRTDM